MNLIKKLFLILIIVLSVSSLAFAVVPQSQYFYVNDTANVISDTLEEYIINTNVELNQKTKAQIVVVSVETLEGKSIEDYSTELFRQYGIGDKDLNNGVLLIVSIRDRDVRIEVGYGLEGRLTDGKCGRILDYYVVPYFKDNNWEDGIKEGYNAILSEVCLEYDITLDSKDGTFKYAQEEMDYEDPSENAGKIFFPSIIIFLICRIINWLVAYYKPLLKLIMALSEMVVVSIIEFLLFTLAWNTPLNFFYVLLLNFLALIIAYAAGAGGVSGSSSSGRRWPEVAEATLAVEVLLVVAAQVDHFK